MGHGVDREHRDIFSNTNITNYREFYYVTQKAQNRRQTESNQARLNCRGAKEEDKCQIRRNLLCSLM